MLFYLVLVPQNQIIIYVFNQLVWVQIQNVVFAINFVAIVFERPIHDAFNLLVRTFGNVKSIEVLFRSNLRLVI